MFKKEVTIADIHSAKPPLEAYSLILKEKEGVRYVPIIVGTNEVRAILVEMNESPTYRPLTHELFISLAGEYNCILREVVISDFEKGVYFADIVMVRPDQSVFYLDARPSDAIALALHYKASIFMDDEVFEANCQQDGSDEPLPTEMEDIQEDASWGDDDDVRFIEQKLSEMSDAELSTLLEGAIESEDFELASKIQSELDSRKL